MNLGKQVRAWVATQLPLLEKRAMAVKGAWMFSKTEEQTRMRYSRFGVFIELTADLNLMVSKDGEVMRQSIYIETADGKQLSFHEDVGDGFIRGAVSMANRLAETIDALPHMQAAAEAWRLKRSVKSVPGISKRPKRI